MSASRLIESAREHLTAAEADYHTADGLYHLSEGLTLLEEAMLSDDNKEREVATNLVSTYSSRICESIKSQVAKDPRLPEPQLEHLFQVLLAFDAAELELPDYVRELKVEVVRRLIDRYYQGYSAEEKQKALEQLAGIAGDSTPLS